MASYYIDENGVLRSTDDDEEYEVRNGKLKKKKKKTSSKTTESITPSQESDIAPVDDRKWYQKGHFEDGYDFGDVTKTILGIEDKKTLKTFAAPETDLTLEELRQKKDYLNSRTWNTADQSKDALEYTKQYNQMALAQYSETLAKTQMDGQEHTVLEEIEILANMKSGKEKDERKDAVLKKMEELGMDTAFYSHFAGDGEFDWNYFGKLLYSSAFAGLNAFNKGMLDTADVILGAPLKALGWENNPISKGAEYYGTVYDTYKHNADLYAEKLGGDAWNFGTEAIEGIMGAVPNALLLFMTGGTSATATTSSLTTQSAMQTGNWLTKAGLTVESMMKNPQYWMSFSRTLGSDYKEAKELGASDVAATVGSILKSSVNAGIEIGLDGGSGIQGLDDALKKGGKPFYEWVESSLEEGGEEMLQKFVGEVVNKAGYGNDAEILNPIEYAKEGALGIISGAALGGGQTAVQSGVNAYNQHQADKLTADEQKVVDKLMEEATEEMTPSEKKAFQQKIREDLEKGYVTKETLEDVLGDKTTLDALQKEADEFDKLYNTPSGELSKAQQDRLAELEGKNKENPYKTLLETEKGKLSQSVLDRVKGTRLEETYREQARRGEDFVADFSKIEGVKHYDAAKKTIENAIKAGANNTNRVHDFMDLSAKVAGDLGKPVYFYKNGQAKAAFIERQTKLIEKLESVENRTEDQEAKLAKLKDTLAKVESGKIQVNGINYSNGIGVNLDSPKPLNRLVVHEVLHDIDEKGYAKLKDKVYRVAKAKGQDLNQMLEEYKAIYDGVDGADPETEMINDLLADYFGADTDFIMQLSTDQDLFHRVLNKIKHLWNMATAGSKEKRELERLKNEFEKVWAKASEAQKNTADGGVNYSTNRTKSMSWADQVNGALYDGKNIRRNDTLVVCNPTDTIIAGEVENKPLAIPQSVLTKASSGKDISHSIKRGKLAKLDDGIKNAPIVIVNPERNAIVYVTNIKQGGLPVIAAFDMNAHFDGDDVHKATSIHLQVDTRSMLESLPESATVYVQKNELDPVGATNNLRGLAAKIKFIDGTIAQVSRNVKYSLTKADSDYMDAVNRGDTNSLEAMVDKAAKDAGYDIKAYHGTGYEFTVFDKSKQGDNYKDWGRLGKGFYFAPTSREAETWAELSRGNLNKVMPVYLRSENMLDSFEALPDNLKDTIPEDWDSLTKRLAEKYAYHYIEYMQEFGYDVQKILTEKGYDGINGHVEFVVFDPEQVKSADSITYDDNGNVIPLSERFKKDNDDIRFSLSKAVEQNKDLVALHNLTAEKLTKSLELGGLPMPSLAITKADIPHSNFGEITLIFGKETIDPKANKKNKVYSADAWTPVFPRVEYEADSKVSSKISQKLRELQGNVDDFFHRDLNRVSYDFEDLLNREGGEEGLIQRVMDNDGLKAAYLEDIGKHIDKVTKQEEAPKNYNPANADKYHKVLEILGVSTAEEIRKVNLKEARDNHGAELEELYPGITQSALRMGRVFGMVQSYLEQKDSGPVYQTVTDGNATQKAVDDALDAEGYEAWVRNLFSGIEKDSGIYNNKERYTPSGSRRTFKQTHLPVTLENIVKAMATQNGGNAKNVSGFHGVKTLRASTAETFKSIEQMHQRKDRLQNKTDEELTAIQDELQNRLFGVMEAIDNESGQIGDSNPYIRLDSIGEAIAEIGESGKYGIADIQKVFKEYSRNISDDTAMEVKQLLYDVAQMPVNIFEAKPERVVGFDEAKVFVIPNNADVKLKQELLSRGCSIAEYDPNIEGHRQQVVNQFEEYKFSLSPDGKDTANRGRSDIYGKDFLKNDFAPIREDVENTVEGVAPDVGVAENETTTEEYPIQDEENLEREKAKLAEEFQRRREELTELLRDKNAFFSKRASELYLELRGLKKGVKASDALGYLLDTGYEWSSIRSALVNIRHTPGERVNMNSAVESIARQMLNEEYEDLQYDLDDLDAEYEKQVKELEKNARKPRLTRKGLHESIVEDIRGEFARRGADFDEALKKAKNLSTFDTVDNTPQRVMEKSLGYKEGGILADLTVNKVAQATTEKIKWLNTIKDRKNGLLAQLCKQYHIKPGSKKSAAAQMYAEGFYVNENNELVEYGDRELALDFPDVNVQNDIKGLAADPRIRKFYDDSLDMANESRVRNLYPEIPRRDNYFLHFRAQTDTYSRLGLPFNPNDIRAKDLPTDLNGVTADLKPGQPYFASSMQRKGNKTTYDLLGGLERYADAVSNQIFYIDSIQTLRALRNHLADTYGQANGLEGLDELTEEEAQERIKEVYSSHLSTFAKFLNEEANVLAGKTALIDRGIEGIIGRRGITFLDTINRQVGSNAVGYSASSAIVNFDAIPRAFVKANKADFIKAFGQMVVNAVSRKSDGFAENSPVVIRRKGAERFHRTLWQKMSDPGYALMGKVDEISTELIARAKYNELTRKGMDAQKAHFETDKWVSKLMGDRSLGQQPQIFNSKMLGLLTKFQLEVRNNLDSMFYDSIQEAKVSNEHIQGNLERNARTAAKATTTIAGLAIAQHIFGKAFESVAGYNPSFDIIEAVIKAFGWDDEEEEPILDNLEEAFLTVVEDMPYSSVFTGGRIPIQNALPIKELVTGIDEYGNEKSRWETLGEIAPYYLMPGGYGQIKKTTQGLGMFLGDHPIDGSYTDSGKLRFPVEDHPLAIAQAALFGQYASKNARDYFDNDWAPLADKQITEYSDLGMDFKQYHKIRDGLKDYDTLAEKVDYIYGLDISDEQKNILVNNLTDRKTPIDMSNYGEYGSFEEFDYAQKNPDKYQFFKDNGISYDDYANADEVGKREYSNMYEWVTDYPGKYEMSKAISDDFLTYWQYKSELNDLKADKDSNGNTISGSKKEKVIDYINNLDLDYGQKIILFRSMYDSQADRDAYNSDILEYLNSRDDISYEEMATILTELGFKVSGNTVTWD